MILGWHLGEFSVSFVRGNFVEDFSRGKCQKGIFCRGYPGQCAGVCLGRNSGTLCTEFHTYHAKCGYHLPIIVGVVPLIELSGHMPMHVPVVWLMC